MKGKISKELREIMKHKEGRDAIHKFLSDENRVPVIVDINGALYTIESASWVANAAPSGSEG